jgi:hypothetical protein
MQLFHFTLPPMPKLAPMWLQKACKAYTWLSSPLYNAICRPFNLKYLEYPYSISFLWHTRNHPLG